MVSHSQGNLYANSAYQALTSEQKPYAQIVGVATPAAYVGELGNPRGFKYITRHDDRIIQFVIGSLPSNTNYHSGSIFSLNHNMDEDYIQDPVVGSVLNNAIKQAVNSAEMPEEGIFAGGVISVTLTWGAQRDLDLHIWEPEGSHVWYADKNGLSGTLDYDDTNGYGPENYQVYCENLQAGTYKVGVHFYWGDGPDTAYFRMPILWYRRMMTPKW